jgi:DNA-binding transcriptional LysR family regulator
MSIDKLRAIRYFVRTVDAGSFAAAARSLEVSPSALSKALTGLEELVGFTLYARSTRKLALTEDGRMYSECCREVLLQLEEAELGGRRNLSGTRGTLRFGIHPAMRLALLRELKQFLGQNPSLQLEMISTNAPGALLEQGLDVVICIGALADSSLVALPLGLVHFVICGSPQYLAEHGEPKHPDDLAAHDGIVYAMPDESPATRWEMVRGGERRLIAPPVRLAVRDGAGAIDAAIHGCGLARPFDIAIRPDLAAGRLRSVLDDWQSPPEPVHALVPTSRRLPSKVRSFIEFVRSLI